MQQNHLSPGFARTHWGPYPLAAFDGPTFKRGEGWGGKERGGQEMGRKGRGGEERGGEMLRTTYGKFTAYGS